MFHTVAVIPLIFHLLATSAAEIPHVTPNQLLEWPDEAHEYYFVIAKSAPDRKLYKYTVCINIAFRVIQWKIVG